MLLLRIMVGLTFIAIGLLLVSVVRLRNQRAEARLLKLKMTADKEELFLQNCKHYQLSVRQSDILRLILEGKTYRQTAERLFISEKTVDAHLRNIYVKAGVKNKVELLWKFYP